MSRKFSLGALFAAVVIAAIGVGPVAAQSSQDGYRLYEYFYYADEALTQQVGHSRESCNGPAVTSGVESPYYRQYPVGYFDYGSGRCVEY